MKKTVIVLLVVLGLADMVKAQEADNGLGLDLSVDFMSKYIWRGQVVSDDWVMQPAVSWGLNGLTLGIWGNVDMTDDQDADWEFLEVDYYVDYTTSVTDLIDVSVGYIYYDFPAFGGHTSEVYGGLGFDTILSPTVTWYYDFDFANGSYIALGLSHSVALSDSSPLALDLGLNLGWADANYNDAYFGSDSSGFNDLTLSAGLPLEMGSVTITPMLNYSMMIDSGVRDGARRNDVWYGGVGVSTSF